MSRSRSSPALRGAGAFCRLVILWMVSAVALGCPCLLFGLVVAGPRFWLISCLLADAACPGLLESVGAWCFRFRGCVASDKKMACFLRSFSLSRRLLQNRQLQPGLVTPSKRASRNEWKLLKKL